MAPVLRALRESDTELDARFALTGQHDELVHQVLQVFKLRPDYDLGIMKPGQDLYDLASGCLQGFRGILEELSPDLVLVQGDTASVFFTALGAFFEKTRIGHVEAGLRSRHPAEPYPDPFPEEMFRRLTGVLTGLHFAPTPLAKKNLLAEGVDPGRVFLTGNTVVDALLEAASVPHEVVDPVLGSVLGGKDRLVLLTAHRRESFGEPLKDVFRAVRAFVDASPGIAVVYPVHPNPQVLGPARDLLSDHPRIHLTDPLGYLDMVQALKAAAVVLTDSGGIQEEAPTFGTPVVVLREATERPEGVQAGAARLVGTDGQAIVEAALEGLARARIGQPGVNPYGDGRAGERIADIVTSVLTGTDRKTTDWAGA
jgi:UDP-N-acetylglucosamine 2-epimerase (non-hydrolysing)